MLKARDYRPDLDSRLGKTVMVAGARDAASGYHCKVCDCVLKDSKTYLDHINGRKRAFGCGVGGGGVAYGRVRSSSLPILDAAHADQKALGFQMQVERHSADDVKARLAAKKKTQAQSKEKPSEAYSFEERIAKLQEEEALRKVRGWIVWQTRQWDRPVVLVCGVGCVGLCAAHCHCVCLCRKRRRRPRRSASRRRPRRSLSSREVCLWQGCAAARQTHPRGMCCCAPDAPSLPCVFHFPSCIALPSPGLDPEMAALMGFSGFGGSKKT